MEVNDLYTEYARCIEMCKGTALGDEPWRCVKDPTGNLFEQPRFRLDPEKYTFAVAVLENKPVFVWDILYDTQGRKYSYYESRGDFVHIGSLVYNQSVDLISNGKSSLSWQPLSPKKDLKGWELLSINAVSDNCFNVIYKHTRSAHEIHMVIYGGFDVEEELLSIIGDSHDQEGTK